jgi:5'-3' exonuclease
MLELATTPCFISFNMLTFRVSLFNAECTQDTPPIDNFYLDMNGIIHMATHNNADSFIETNEEEMFKRIFIYTDRLYKLVAPTRLMFLAVDGVAPRAKDEPAAQQALPLSQRGRAVAGRAGSKRGRNARRRPF